MVEIEKVAQRSLLLVDDEHANLSGLRLFLRELGHEIVCADNGARAIALFDERPPDLILLDFHMPGIDGVEVLRYVRAHEGDRHVPVIMVTGHSDREHRVSAIDAGADEFLEKPIDGHILLTRVKTLLQLEESREALRASRDALEARNVALERLQREQRDLTAFVIHDLKNPLAAVVTNLSFLAQELDEAPEIVREALDDTQEGAARLQKMIEDLLLISRLEEAQVPLQREAIPVTDLLCDLAAQYARRALERHIAITPPPPHPVKVSADRSLLRRVLENILDNALRHTPRDGQVALLATADGDVEIAVANTGPRIPAAERARIFEKFVRGSRESSAHNAGLGLYFCRRAIEAHGGIIEVRETLQWPTSFVLRLPAA